MCADRRKHHDDEFRREALKLIKAGTEDGSLVRRPAMPVRDRVGNGMTRARSWPDCLWSNKRVRRHHQI